MLTPAWMCVPVWQFRAGVGLLSNQRRNQHIGGWVKMKRYCWQAADQWRRYTRTRQVSSRAGLTPRLSSWLKLRESSFELVKFKSSSELKTEASNVWTSFNILPIVQTTIGRYQHNNWLIPIIGKTADNRAIPIIGRLSVHLYKKLKLTVVSGMWFRSRRLETVSRVETHQRLISSRSWLFASRAQDVILPIFEILQAILIKWSKSAVARALLWQC